MMQTIRRRGRRSDAIDPRFSERPARGRAAVWPRRSPALVAGACESRLLDPQPDAAPPTAPTSAARRPPVQRRLSGHVRLLLVHAGRAQRRPRSAPSADATSLCRSRTPASTAAIVCRPAVRGRPVRGRHPGLRVRRRRVRCNGPTAAARATATGSRRSRSAWRRARASRFRTAARAGRIARGDLPRVRPGGRLREDHRPCARSRATPMRARPSAPTGASHLLRGRLPERVLHLTTARDAPSARHRWGFRPIAWRRRAGHIKCAFAHIKSLNGRLK